MIYVIIFSILLLGVVYSFWGWLGVTIASTIYILVGIWLHNDFKKSAENEERLRRKQKDEHLLFVRLNDAHRIFSDSYHIVTTTTNIDTFCSRYDLLLEKADELQSIIGKMSLDDDLQENILRELNELPQILPTAKERVLRESFNKTVLETEILKTKSGKLNRYSKYLNMLSEHSDFFCNTSEYDTVCSEVQANIDELKNNSSSKENDMHLKICITSDSLGDEDTWQQESMQRSAYFAAEHEKRISTINISALEKVEPAIPLPLLYYEVLFLSYMHGYRDGSDIASYWTHDYHIDYQSTLEKFFSYGYMCFEDIPVQLSKYKVADFKEFLSSHGIKDTGKKQELIDRIIENFEDSVIDKSFPRRILKTTDAGKAVIASRDYVFYFNQNMHSFNIPLHAVETAHLEYPQLSKSSLAMKLLSDRALKNLNDKNYGLYRCDLLAQATVYHDTEEFDTELELLFQVCFLDYYGYDNNGTQSMNDSFFAPAVLWRVKHSPVYEALGDNAEEFYFQSIRKLPSDFTQKSRPHYSFVKVIEAVTEYEDYHKK